MSKLLKAKEAAEYLGYSESKFCMLVDSGQLPFVKFDHSARRYLESDLNKFIISHRQYSEVNLHIKVG